ncbi:MAG: PspC domain-containing protein [Methylococcaceae bacterium]|nr:PspC domain-containing protein [Methylococcaceae bacterium]
MNRRKLERDLDHRKIGGVCSGLARFFGVDRTLVRLIFFVSIFFSFSLSFWLYLVLWILLPGTRSPIRASLSGSLRKKVQHLDKLVERTEQRLNLPGSRQRLIAVHELVETLLPDFESRSLSRKPELRPVYQAALVHFPELLEQYLRLPSDYAARQPMESGKTAQEQLDDELSQLEKSLKNIAMKRYGQSFAQTAEVLDTLQSNFDDDPTSFIRQKLETLQTRVSGRLDTEAEAKIERIKTSLLAALSRLLQTADPADPNLYNVRQIALDYLPETVDRYLAIPPALATSQAYAQGKTAQAILHEQLDLLDSSLRQLVTSLYREDAQGLLIHGNFLRDKFLDHRPDWLDKNLH